MVGQYLCLHSTVWASSLLLRIGDKQSGGSNGPLDQRLISVEDWAVGYVLPGLFLNFLAAFQYCEGRQLSSVSFLLSPGVLGGGLGLCSETASKGMEGQMHLLGCNTKKMKRVPLKGTHVRQSVACCTRQQCSKGDWCKDAYILNTCTSIYIKDMLIIALVDLIWCSSLRHPGFVVMIFSSQPSSKRSKLKLLCCLSSLKLAKKLEW